MPRPKVPVDKRKRVVQACVHCRNSKKRCNAQQPCSNCIRKGVANSCTFDETLQTVPIVLQSGDPEASTQSHHITGGSSLPSHGSIHHTYENPARSPAVTIDTLASSPEALHRTHPRLLNNKHGEKVFFGGSASLAFLQYIRETVSQSLENSTFTDYANVNHMLEGPAGTDSPVEDLQLTSQQEDEFTERFMIASKGLVELFDHNGVEALLESYRTNSLSLKPMMLAIVRVIFAIGAQCSARTEVNRSVSRSCFQKAQSDAFAGRIEDPCIEMVELFLLMAFYMLGACRRNAAFMYIGVAAQAAYALGFHSSLLEIRPATDARRQHRVKTAWKCLVTLDTIVSSILGRPPATSNQLVRRQDQHMSAMDDVLPSFKALQANYELACLLNQNVQELYAQEKVSTEGARLCLDALNAWSSRLPPELRSAPNTQKEARAQEYVIGGLNVSCFYYFVVMLVSRPFLVVHLANRMARHRTSPRSELAGSISPTENETEIEAIADACLHAATYMVQTCMEVKHADVLPDNMRVLKAWTFTAGLVLGFEMFSSDQSEPEIEEAFRDSNEILKKLALHSPQAAHNAEILTSLSDAIATRRRRSLNDRRRSARPMVEKIMIFHDTQASQGANSDSIGNSDQSVSAASAITSTNAIADDWMANTNMDFDFQNIMNEPFLNWDNTDFLAWDPFSHAMSN